MRLLGIDDVMVVLGGVNVGSNIEFPHHEQTNKYNPN